MADATEEFLAQFVRTAGHDVPVAFAAPARDASSRAVCFALVGLAPDLAVRKNAGEPLRIDRRYLVLATGADPGERGRVIESLMFRALESPDVQVETGAPANDFWIAMGLPPQPAFIMRVPVRHGREVIRAAPVKTVVLDLEPGATLSGHAVDADGHPVPRGTVERPTGSR